MDAIARAGVRDERRACGAWVSRQNGLATFALAVAVDVRVTRESCGKAAKTYGCREHLVCIVAAAKKILGTLTQQSVPSVRVPRKTCDRARKA